MGLFGLVLSNQLLKSRLVPNHLKTSINHLRFAIATLLGKSHVALDWLSSLSPPLSFFPIFWAKGHPCQLPPSPVLTMPPFSPRLAGK